jgi:hypothetical protein
MSVFYCIENKSSPVARLWCSWHELCHLEHYKGMSQFFKGAIFSRLFVAERLHVSRESKMVTVKCCGTGPYV